ncbi:MAG: hypothetical protein RLZZ500_2592 [Bacteroidota bacterium]|jgi:signal transduction histidine kinase
MQTLRQLFPFYLRLDHDLNFIEYGPSMGKLRTLSGKFEDHFQYIRPNFEITYTFESIVEFSNQVFVLELRNSPNKIRIKGQFIIHHEVDNELWFCGSPWLMSMEDILKYNLVITDFALHDSAVDTFLMMNQNTLTLEDSTKMITDLRHKNESLEKINQRLDSIIYAITHDFRAPLLASIGLLQLPEPLLYSQVPDVLHTLKKLDRTIIHLNELSKNDKVELKITALDLKGMIQEIYSNYQIIYNVSVPLQLTIESVCPFNSDSFRIRTILNNLISNALKYSKANTESYVSIDIQITEETCLLTISDNGEGIDQKNLNDIFKLFFRASAKSQGSGIGLYVIKEMIHFLKGTITVTSEKGIGTTFKITLPNQNLNHHEKN